MMSFLKTAVLIATILGASHGLRDTEINFLTKSWEFKGPPQFKLLNRADLIGKDHGFAYAECDFSRNLQSIDCKFTQEYMDVNGFNFIDKCQVDISAQDGHQVIGAFVRSVSGNRILYTYIEPKKHAGARFDAKMYLRSLDMSTCEYAENIIYVNSTHHDEDLGDEKGSFLTVRPQILQHKDKSYDVFVLANNLCSGARCKYSVDTYGHHDGKIVSYLPKEYELNDVQFHPTGVNDSYFAVVTKDLKEFSRKGKDDKGLTILYAKPGGEANVLLQLPNEQRLHDIDIIDGHLNICWTDEKTGPKNGTRVHCKQYSPEGYETHGDFQDLLYSVQTLKINSIAKNYFFRMTEECHEDGCSKGSWYHLKNISLKRTYVPHSRTLRIDGFQPEDVTAKDDSVEDFVKYSHLILDPRGNVCVSVAAGHYSHAKPHSKLSLFRKCFSNLVWDIKEDQTTSTILNYDRFSP